MKKNKEIDHRQGQKVILTIELLDNGQDFTELDVLENGVILGNSPMFSHGRLSLLGVGDLDGVRYIPFDKKEILKKRLSGMYVYLKNTGEKDPLPWKAVTLKYIITGLKKAFKPARFMQVG